MKKFTIRLFLLLSLLFLINVFLFVIRQEGFKKYTDNIFSDFKFKTFLFADSHGNCLNRDIKTFKIHNLSYGSDSYKDIRRKIEFLVGKGVAMDTIILTIDPHTLGTYRDKANNYQYSSFFENKASLYLPIIEAQYTTSLPKLIELKVSSFIRNREEIPLEPEVFAGLDKKEQRKSMIRRLSSQFHHDYASEDLRGELLRIMRLCEHNNIILYGLRFPLVSDYNDLIKDKDYGAYKLFVQNGIPVLFYQDSISDYSLFRDQDHLNDDGGMILLTKIKRDLLNPIKNNGDDH